LTLPPTGIKCDLIATGGAQHKLPAVYPFPCIARVGGLIAYGPTTSIVAPVIMSTRPQKRETRRAAAAGADQIGANDQPQTTQALSRCEQASLDFSPSSTGVVYRPQSIPARRSVAAATSLRSRIASSSSSRALLDVLRKNQLSFVHGVDHES
jgi:hypothetical protein